MKAKGKRHFKIYALADATRVIKAINSNMEWVIDYVVLDTTEESKYIDWIKFNYIPRKFNNAYHPTIQVNMILVKRPTF